MAVPVPMPTAARDETHGGVTYHIEGGLVPVLHLDLLNVRVYFEHHILLRKDPQVDGILWLHGFGNARSAGAASRGRGGWPCSSCRSTWRPARRAGRTP